MYRFYYQCKLSKINFKVPKTTIVHKCHIRDRTIIAAVQESRVCFFFYYYFLFSSKIVQRTCLFFPFSFIAPQHTAPVHVHPGHTRARILYNNNIIICIRRRRRDVFHQDFDDFLRFFPLFLFIYKNFFFVLFFFSSVFPFPLRRRRRLVRRYLSFVSLR